MRSAIPVLFLAAGLASAVTPSESLKFAPGPYNTVTVINVEAILKSPRAVREKWAEKDHTEYLAGAIPFHPSVSSIIATTEFRPGRKGGGVSGIVAPTKRPMDLAAVAKAVRGEQTTAGGESVVLAPSGMYLLKLTDDLVGAVRADSKQDVGRWVRDVREKKTGGPSRYLREAMGSLRTNQIQIAVDVEDLFERKDVVNALALTPGLAEDPKTLDAVTEYLAGLRGVRVTANVSDKDIRLTITLDGATPPKVKAEVLKAIVIDLVERAGAGLTDLRAATPLVEVNQFSLTLGVTDDELAMITAAVLPPPPPAGDLDAIRVSTGEVTREATARYLAAADRVVKELFQKSQRAQDYLKTAAWHDAAANRLISLSVLRVDPQAVEFAYGTADVLHQLAESLRGVPIEAAQLESKAYYYQSGSRRMHWAPGWGWSFTPAWANGGGAVVTNLPEIARQQAEVVARDREKRTQLWKLIESKRSELTGSLGRPK